MHKYALLLLPLLAGAEPLSLKDGDRVVVVGNTLIERELRDSYWETALTRHFPGKAIVWRNLGWSGDTVRGEARGSFGGQPQGYKHLKEHVLALKPTVLILAYGNVESFAGPEGVAKFKADYAKLLDDLAPAKARIYLLSTTPMENLPGKADRTAQQNNLRIYASAIGELARERKLEYIELFAPLLHAMEAAKDQPLTTNGVHLTADGYRRTAPLIEKAFGLNPDAGKTEHLEALRAAIVEKNTLYFYRWRPANETYIFGFRKKEQGNNAVEIPQFDPLVEQAEARIRKLTEKGN